MFCFFTKTKCKCLVEEIKDMAWHDITPLEERSKLLYKLKLSYECLKSISEEHNLRKYSQRRTCKLSKEIYLTSLHGLHVGTQSERKTVFKDKHDSKQCSKQDENDTSSAKTFQYNSSYEGSIVVSMCVVSVRMPHKQSNIALSTYALLESCSQGTFVTEGVRKEMNLKKKDTTITVKTRNWEVTENSKVIEGSKVSSSTEFGQQIVRLLRLPKSHTIKDTPVDTNDTGFVSFVATKTWSLVY